MIQEIIFTAPGIVQIRTVEDVPPQAGQVKVRTVLSGISHGTEMNLFRGTAPGFHRRWDGRERVFRGDGHKKSFPVEPGYECVGRIIAVGHGVETVPVGGLVWVDRPHKSAHIVTEREAQAGLLAPEMTAERGIFAALTRVALGGVHDAAIKVGDRVAVIGLGTIGLLTVQLALLNGAAEVYAFDNLPKRLEMARSLGATAVHTSDPDAARVVRSKGVGVDVAIETSGQYRGLQVAIACCALGATVVVVSSYQGDAHELRLGEEFHRNRINLLSSMTVNNAPHRSHPHWDVDRLNETARRLLSEGKLCVEPLITQVFPFRRAADAYRLIADTPENCIRVALRPDEE